MCQMSIVMEKIDQKDKIIKDVIKLEITDKGIMVSTFFDEPKFIDNVIIKEVDCLASTVTLLES